MATVFNHAHDEVPVRLHNGDRMKQPEFHNAYKKMPLNYRAELVGGIVFEPSPLEYPHGTSHIRLTHLLQSYVIATPGVEAADNATVILSDEDEVQPDVILRVVRKCGGQSRATKFVEGAPELVAEVAHSSRAIDLHLKKQRYALAGVLEYIVLSLEPQMLHWFDLKNDAELIPEADGITRSVVFPGLWIHCQGLLELDHNQTVLALTTGIQSSEHEEYIQQLAESSRRRKRKSSPE